MGLFRFLFMEKKCLVHTAFGNEPYASAANKFNVHGISYDVVRKSSSNANVLDSVFGGAERSTMPFARASEINNTQYDFYVKKEDEHLAQRAMHR